MLKLDTTTRNLKIQLGGSVTTNELPVTVCYNDQTGDTYAGATQVSSTTGATLAIICSAPAASTTRDIDYVNVWNKDTAQAVVNIIYNDNGTTYQLISATLAGGDQLEYTHGEGWKTLTATGYVKTQLSGISAVTITGLADPGSNGVVVRTAANVTTARTITGTANEITLTNGDGVSGNPTVSIPSAVTFTGKTITGGTFNDSTLVRSELTDYKETKSSPSISGGTLTLDFTNGNHFTVSLNANITTLTISNVPSGTVAVPMTLILTADGTQRTIAWPSSFKWPNGDTPIIPFANGVILHIRANSYDNGTTWLPTAVMAETATARLFAWGQNSSGQLGQPDITNRYSPVQIGTQSWTMITHGSDFMAGIKSDGSLWTWGNNASGQLGDGTLIQRFFPQQIGTSSWTAVAAGDSFALAIRTDGALFAWGLGTSGQLGDGTNVTKSSPVQIGTSSWTAVAGGNTHSLGIRVGGTLFTWGLGTTGQLGDGTAVTKSSPVAIGALSWTAVAGRINGSAALRSDGGMFGWGDNANGAVGDGTSTVRSSPVQVGTSSWSALGSGNNHILALKLDKTLWTWGQNSSGQLGDGSTTVRSSPVSVGTSSWTVVTGGNGMSIGIKLDGTLWTWGQNGSGQLGNQSTTGVSSPIQVGSSSWTSLAGGGPNGQFTGAITT